MLRTMSDSEAITRNIRVKVRSQYVPRQSEPERGRWLFAYTIRIINEGDEIVQLLSRHWIIEDAEGRLNGKGRLLIRKSGIIPCSGLDLILF